jgi:hypothetical protein
VPREHVADLVRDHEGERALFCVVVVVVVVVG